MATLSGPRPERHLLSIHGMNGACGDVQGTPVAACSSINTLRIRSRATKVLCAQPTRIIWLQNRHHAHTQLDLPYALRFACINRGEVVQTTHRPVLFFFFLMVVNLKPSQPGDNQIVHEIAGGGFFNSHPRGAYVITELYRGCTRERFYLISRYFVVKQDVPYLPTSRSR